MLEKPAIPDVQLVARAQEEYGLDAVQVTFLPLGADVNTAVYRLLTGSGAEYFLKLRKGAFEEITVSIPHFLHAQGNRAIIDPLETRAGRLWGELAPYKMILYPFIEGQDGYEVRLSDAQWWEFGAVLRKVHETRLPGQIFRQVPLETFSPRWRDMARAFLARAEGTEFVDPVAEKLARFARDHRNDIRQAVDRADELGFALQKRQVGPVLCHADIHAGNLHISPYGPLYIVDWDNPILAPRERDLLLIGGCSTWNDRREIEIFYRGYNGGNGSGSESSVDPMAMAYYRYERLIQDIAAYYEQLFLSAEGNEDRERSLGFFTSIFFPGHELDLAREADALL